MENLFTIFIVAFFVILLFSGVKIIHQQTEGIVETLGKYSKSLSPGLNIIIPIVQKVVSVINLKVQEIQVKVTAKTKDQVFFELPINVQARVSSPKAAYYELDDPRQQMISYVLNQIRGEAAHMDLQEIYEDKNKLEKLVSTSLQEKFIQYGYEIVNVLVDDPILDASIRDAANKVIASKRVMEAAKFEAEAIRVKVVAEAVADAESKKLSGRGYADQRSEIAKGYKESLQSLREALPNVNEETLVAIISQLAWFDTQRDMVKDNHNIVLLPYSMNMATDEMAKLITSLKSGLNNTTV